MIKKKKNSRDLKNWNGKDRWLILHGVGGGVEVDGGGMKNESSPKPK